MKTTISKKDIINVIGKHYLDNFYIEMVKRSKEYKVHVRGKYNAIGENLLIKPFYMDVQCLGTLGIETIYSIKISQL